MRSGMLARVSGAPLSQSRSRHFGHSPKAARHHTARAANSLIHDFVVLYCCDCGKIEEKVVRRRRTMEVINMQKERRIGTVYEFCQACNACPVAEEAVVTGKPGLIIRDDFSGSVQLTDEQLKDLANFLGNRLR